MKKLLFLLVLVLIAPDVLPQDNQEINFRYDRKKKGYYNTTQISLLMGNRQVMVPYYYSSYPVLGSYYASYFSRTESQLIPSVTMTNGYMFNKHWAAGLGVGFEIFERNLFPVFADIRYTLWDNQISPFFAIKTGYAIGSLKKKHYDNLALDFEPYYFTNVDFRNYGGFMLHPEIGVKFPLSKNADLLITVAYRFQKTKSVVKQAHNGFVLDTWASMQSVSDVYYRDSYDKWTNNQSLNRLSFAVAIMFR